MTVLLVAHDVNPLLAHLDRVVYVAGGRIVSGPPGEVITSETLSALYGVAGRGAPHLGRAARRRRAAGGARTITPTGTRIR